MENQFLNTKKTLLGCICESITFKHITMKKKLLLGLFVAASSALFAQDPVLINGDFAELPKNSGSDCACSGWINKDLADQAETSTLEAGVNWAIKFDNQEADGMYQEIEVLPNKDYIINYSFRVSGDADGTSEIELRVLAGEGYIDGYTPTYYTDTVDFPQDSYGYEDIAEVEAAGNNLAMIVESFPGNDDYNPGSLEFNSGSNTSVAIFARGIGNPTTPPVDGKPYDWSAGDQETRFDFMTIEEVLSVDGFELADFSVYPNPSSDVVFVRTNATLETVALYDTLGKKVYESTDTASINVASFAKGVYFLTVNSANGTATKKLVIQ